MESKYRKQLGSDGYRVDNVQSLTGKSTGTAVLGYGLTKIEVASATESGSNDYVFRLNGPVAPGVHKYIIVSGASASTKTISVRTLTSLQTFFGSTYNSIGWTTTINNPPSCAHLIGLSTTQWAVVVAKLTTAAAWAGATA